MLIVTLFAFTVPPYVASRPRAEFPEVFIVTSSSDTADPEP